MNEHSGGPFIYSALGGITLRDLRARLYGAEKIEQLGATKDGNRWRVFDKSKLEFLQPTLATPHSCDTTPDRLHWFLIDARMAMLWATAEALRS
jgi:hypothetical protein